MYKPELKVDNKPLVPELPTDKRMATIKNYQNRIDFHWMKVHQMIAQSMSKALKDKIKSK